MELFSELLNHEPSRQNETVVAWIIIVTCILFLTIGAVVGALYGGDNQDEEDK